MKRAALLTVGVLTALGSLGGCKSAPKAQTARPQAADDAAEKNISATVGQKTIVSNTEPIQVSAVGLVYSLPSTGSPAAGEWRPMLERDLRKKKLNPKQFLEDPNNTCSLVLVSAVIPPGAKKGDMVDIDVVLPRASKTGSLKGGILFECDLTTSELSGNVRERMQEAGMDVGANPAVSGDTILLGKTLIRAEGPLVAGVMENTAKLKASVVGDEAAAGRYTAGRVWSGGRVLEDRPYFFMLNERDANPRTAMEVAARLNATFLLAGDSKNKVANAVKGDVVLVTVPPTYRLNHERFLIVARQVPMIPAGAESLLRKKLEQDLLNPETAITAAVKLEALGAESTRALQTGLQSESPWVRFAAAESLAYLGSTSGAADLAKLAEQHPALRTHCLTALASLDDGVSTDRLVELMKHPDVGLRYGAFVALRSINERHPELHGTNVKKAFWVHEVAPGSQSVVHVASSRRAEVVLFGNAGTLVPPYTIPLGNDFVVAAKAGDENATVTYLAPGKDGSKEVVLKVPSNLRGVLSAVGELGGGYAEAIELIRKADGTKVLAATMAVDALPRGMPITQLAKLARSDSNLEQANVEVTRAATSGDLQLASFDLPSEADNVKQKPQDEPSLNRSPGRLFSAKKHPQEPDPEPPTAAKPSEDSLDLARSPGKLFGK
ncbi:HEAT repeat domain-containing protein [Limnoglobus roseus]|uniref:Flagellar P-ring protein n=1 Tax=Limnoglobus roseus TaxID=2598579 RepID=A0A5C1A9I5_9BACT|nr:HEAT repeat domain-containing protein [Limnoglobus roseus]QEL14887.1 flagellar P-ring protein [Limnoglobus roseus]